MHVLEEARENASLSSAGGAPFFVAYGLTLLITGALAFLLPVQMAALAVLFQGGVALPLAFAIQSRLPVPAMTADNPLRSLTVQMALVQVVALPAVIIVYTLDPVYVPATFAAVAGGHFLPYAWLHRTRIYVVLAVGVALVPWVLMGLLGPIAFAYILLAWGATYLVMALYLLRTFATRTQQTVPA